MCFLHLGLDSQWFISPFFILIFFWVKKRSQKRPKCKIGQKGKGKKAHRSAAVTTASTTNARGRHRKDLRCWTRVPPKISHRFPSLLPMPSFRDFGFQWQGGFSFHALFGSWPPSFARRGLGLRLPGKLASALTRCIRSRSPVIFTCLLFPLFFPPVSSRGGELKMCLKL